MELLMSISLHLWVDANNVEYPLRTVAYHRGHSTKSKSQDRDIRCDMLWEIKS